MRGPAVLALAAALSAPAGAAAEPPAQRTEVHGDVGELAGRWLCVARLDLPEGRTQTNASLWEVTPEPAGLELRQRFAALPAELQEAVEAANRSGRPWTPSARAVARVAEEWERLPPREPRATEVVATLTAREAFGEELTEDPRTRDARWVVRLQETPSPDGGPVMEQVHVYAATERRRRGFAGSYTSVALAAAPFPVPITFHGEFELHALDAPPGLLERLLAVLAGCGR
jgi:hypothetical protein